VDVAAAAARPLVGRQWFDSTEETAYAPQEGRRARALAEAMSCEHAEADVFVLRVEFPKPRPPDLVMLHKLGGASVTRAAQLWRPLTCCTTHNLPRTAPLGI
jgi:hypothetical protein